MLAKVSPERAKFPGLEPASTPSHRVINAEAEDEAESQTSEAEAEASLESHNTGRLYVISFMPIFFSTKTRERPFLEM